MRWSTIHTLACAFLHAALNPTLDMALHWGYLCPLHEWFMRHHDLIIESEKTFPSPPSSIFQTFTFPLSLLVSVVQRSLVEYPAKAPLAWGSARDFLSRAAVLVKLLGTCSSESTAGEGINTHTYTQPAGGLFFNMCSNLWVSNCERLADGLSRVFSGRSSSSFKSLHADVSLYTNSPQLLLVFIMVCVMFLPSGKGKT